MTDNRKQRQKQQRAARKEAERKAQQRKETIRRIGTALGLGAVVAAVLVLVSVFSGNDESLPGSYLAFRDLPTACGADTPAPRTAMSFDAAPDQELSGVVTAVVVTSCGSIAIDLDADAYPETVNSFVFLAREGFYDGTVLHRIVPGFVFQGGDPDATGGGGPGYEIADEFPPSDFVYDVGVVAMANAGRGSTGSQFFVVSGEDAAALPSTFNVLGEVTEGMDTIAAISDVPVIVSPRGERSQPTESVYIESVEISTG